MSLSEEPLFSVALATYRTVEGFTSKSKIPYKKQEREKEKREASKNEKRTKMARKRTSNIMTMLA